MLDIFIIFITFNVILIIWSKDKVDVLGKLIRKKYYYFISKWRYYCINLYFFMLQNIMIKKGKYQNFYFQNLWFYGYIELNLIF